LQGSVSHQESSKKAKARHRLAPGLKEKDLLLLPARVALALQADGWWIRSDIIWAKPNPMPESVKDRPTKSHEYVFLLSKSERYFYDAIAIEEEATGDPRAPRNRWDTKDYFVPGQKPQKRVSRTGSTPRHNGLATNHVHLNGVARGIGTRNRRSVWWFATSPYAGAHFATFPPRLAELCILAGTSAHGACWKCGAPWERAVTRTRSFESGSGKSGRPINGKHVDSHQGGGATLDIRRGPIVTKETVGWEATCDCQSRVVPCHVLDPFAGSGTTGAVALKLGRDATLIELNKSYLPLILERCGQ
jgi:hypothetical protein